LLRVGVIGASGMGACMAAVAPWLVPLVYGKDTSMAPWIMMILLPGIVGFFALHTLSTDLIAKGRPGLVAAVAGTALVLNASVCILYAIPTHGVWGAAVTTSASYLFAAASMLVVYLRVTRVPLREAVVPRLADFPIEQVLGRIRRAAPKR
jgi:O-antigen/teichoic acid export membrane protein